jgi:hypothetical protein
MDFFLKELEVQRVTATETVYEEGGMTEQIEHTAARGGRQHLGLELSLVCGLQRHRAGAAHRQCRGLQTQPNMPPMTGLAIARLLHEAGVPTGRHGLPGRCRRRSARPCWRSRWMACSSPARSPPANVLRRRWATSSSSLQLELGGKDPTYVCDDADPRAAAESLADGAMYNTGQSCCSVERIYVHESIHDAFVAAFCRHRARRTALGDPTR